MELVNKSTRKGNLAASMALSGGHGGALARTPAPRPHCAPLAWICIAFPCQNRCYLRWIVCAG